MTTTDYKNWTFNIDSDHILWLTLDRANSAVNALNAEIIAELDQLLQKPLKDPTLAGVVICSGKPSGFIAGADIEQFVALKNQAEAFDLVRQAQLIFDKLAALKIPTVAMIKGFCLGGGLELALACRYRVAEEGAKTLLGAPEVNLGLHPGWGGTIRLPRLIGLFPAMQMNLTGKPVNAKAAAKLGLVDVAVPERHLLHAARYYVLHKPRKHHPAFWQDILNNKFLRPCIAKLFYKNLTKKVNRTQYPAPYAIVDNWLKYGIESDAAMVREAKSIAELLVGNTSRNLVRAFFLQTRLKSLAKGADFSAQHVHVIGAGIMGGDIAAWCALKGFRVTFQDRLPELVASAMKRAADLFHKKLKSAPLEQAALDRLTPDLTGAGIAKADIVIEAVSENLAIKQSIYQLVEPYLKPNAILATNTSSLHLDALSTVLKKPERLVGIHFFNPVPMMQLVEVVQSGKTDPAVVNQAMAFVRSIDRLPLPVQSCPGFLVNRVLMPYLMEAIILLDEGKSPEAIDQAALTFGMPMGPIELADTVGLDVCLAVAEILARDHHLTLPKILQEKVTRGEFGRKSGKGFYQYKKCRPIKKKHTEGFETLIDRLILPILNESVACVRENIVSDSDLLDVGLIFGAGFAPFRGGPLQYAKSEGISQIVERLKILQKAHGERFKPDTGWLTLETGQDFQVSS